MFNLRSMIWPVLGAISIVFHLWLIFSGLIPNLISRPLHMALALPWVFIYIAKSRFQRLTGSVLCVVGVTSCLWIAANQSMLGDQYAYLSNSFQFAIAICLLLVTLEMARRAISWPLPMVALIALAYGLWGQYIPGEFGHPGTPTASFLGTLTIAEGGIWGKLTGISVNIVAIFVIFGAVLNAGEAGQGFMNVAAAAAGRLRGGAAKVSVISSALFGSISGSASANVASTGAITLPAMTRLGYPRPFAAAVEAVASSGGQIMPPLMGAGAFVMVELTGIPYSGIMIAALLPAVLYFFAVWVGIDAFASRYDLKAVPLDERPELKQVIITSAFFLIPFSVLLWGMFGAELTPQYSACMAIIVGAVLLWIDRNLTFDTKRSLKRIKSVCLNSGVQIATIASIILCASIIIGVLGITGLGVKITSLILSGSGGMLWPALLLTAFACLILGMEVPTTAAYVICVSVAGPALIKLGLGPLQTHLFIFWFALLSTITPPVCGAVFIAAGMVQENWLKVAGIAMSLGIGLYLIPLGMIANPALIELGTAVVPSLLAAAKMALALGMISFGIIAPKAFLFRIFLVLAGLIILFV
ncbi:TRAP transporter fused permease subunit [uncultured Paraglaciecola sp.]|jgi:TRAP transporter 4TM/12TM fusion protein|uniref:TRAP transporter permease n=1 Tax=uncultured Paraglaciecola sp. TaxID=1765024 RepID=UPI0025FAC9D9|nr:TRAP transporter fused permease subunit [uncultured Paraglaciecola sp.]